MLHLLLALALNVFAAESVTVKGTVLRTDPLSGTNEKGINMQVETDTGVLHVHIGPMWFTNARNVVPQTGDPVTIVGMRFSLDKKPDVEAREVTIHGKKITVWEKPSNRGTASPIEDSVKK